MTVGSETRQTGIDAGSLERATLPHRWLGKTGEQVPALGMGTGPGGLGMEDDKAIALYERAIDLGVTYFDTAPGYRRAQTQLGQVMRRRRDEVFLVTKTSTARADEALKILGKSLQDLQTERVDLTYVHSLGNLDVDQVLAGDGALAGLREAQKRGWTRYVGFTAHNMPWKAARVLREADVDVAMVALNFVDRHTYNFHEAVLPLAAERGVGIAAMKVYGGARDMKYDKPRPSALETHGSDYHEKALRYVLSLPGVAVAVIGMYREEELLQNVEWVQNHSPIAPAEEKALVSQGREIAKAWGPHFGPVR